MPAVSHEEIFLALGNAFYDVVPEKYRTYCALTSQISQQALKYFGIESTVVACEVWYVSSTGNFVVGNHATPSSEKWPGHAICLAEDWLIDAALHHFKRQFELEVPDLVVKKTFGIDSNVIGRFDAGPQDRIWWHRLPHTIVMKIPQEPEDIVSRCALDLANEVESRLAGKERLSA
ncbi:MAG TPA: hypothetical protein VMH83_15175 [Candidatus Acidoferrum sp.]|nr:hypothetical protein [Candidatus Acidoferrum sp.]